MSAAGGGGEVPIAADADVVRVRQLVRTTAQQAGLGLVDLTKVVTAASELARNTLVHGGGGSAVVEAVAEPRGGPGGPGGRRGVRATFVDRGPGIPDVHRAFQDGWSSGGGLGLGLSGARRLVDEFHLTSDVGSGTRVVVVKWGR